MRMTPVVRLGVVGCGWLAERVHLPALARLQGVRVVALSDPDPDRLAHVRPLASGAACHATPGPLLADPAIDAVLVAAPTGVHAALAVEAFRAGKHVYLEKPVATNMADTQQVLAAWQSAGTVGMVGYNFRRNTVFQAAVQRVREGQLGALHAVQGGFHVAAGAVPGWRADPAAGGGVLLDLFSHHVDLVAALTGDRFISVACRTATRRAPEDGAEATLVTSGGVTAQLAVSYALDTHVNRLDVAGERGHLVVDLLEARPQPVIRRPGPGARVERLARALAGLHPANLLRSPGHEPSFGASLAAFRDAILEGRPATPGLADGVHAVAVVAAARRSAAENGRPMPVDTTP